MIRILLADDHVIVRRGLRDILIEEFTDAIIGEVGDGESLVHETVTGHWDIVITDLIMPGRSGLEALEQIKKLKPSLPVLVLSIHSEDHFAVRILRAGAAGYLKKDLAPEELIEAVKVVLNGKKYITPAVAERLTKVIDVNYKKEPHELLSDREFEVFKMIATGISISEIGERLFLSTSTISTYRNRILTKMDFNTNADMTVYAIAKGLL
jgi:two-component system, NarL family, invasion response regulator UvrY